MQRDDGLKADEVVPAKPTGPRPDAGDNVKQVSRTRLLFLKDCPLSFDGKLLWAAKLARAHSRSSHYSRRAGTPSTSQLEAAKQ